MTDTTRTEEAAKLLPDEIETLLVRLIYAASDYDAMRAGDELRETLLRRLSKVAPATPAEDNNQPQRAVCAEITKEEFVTHTTDLILRRPMEYNAEKLASEIYDAIFFTRAEEAAAQTFADNFEPIVRPSAPVSADAERMREALLPFAEAANNYENAAAEGRRRGLHPRLDDDCIAQTFTLGQCRAARAALASSPAAAGQQWLDDAGSDIRAYDGEGPAQSSVAAK